MCKIYIARHLVVDISRDAMQILCLSLAGRWWRAECEMGHLDGAKIGVLRPLLLGTLTYWSFSYKHVVLKKVFFPANY